MGKWMNGSWRGRVHVATGVVALLLLSGGMTRADEGILVQGSGEAKGKPTSVELVATLSGDSELAADAIVKFHDAKKKALAAIAAMKNPNLTVISEGISINSPIDSNTQQMMMRGQTVTPTQKVQVQETSRLVLANADKLDSDALMEQVLKILDVAKDSGFIIGPPTGGSAYELQVRSGQPSALVMFKLPDSGPLRDEATKAAMEDARSRAHKIADLAGVKLGRILSVTQGDKVDPSGSASLSILRMIYGNAGRSEEPGKELMGTTAGDLTVHVNMTVQFEIVK